jgi:hypothetical protein
MTDRSETLEQALSIIDRGLTDLQSREIVSASEVSDLLLDLRLLLLEAEPVAEPALSG